MVWSQKPVCIVGLKMFKRQNHWSRYALHK